ncbi:MAG: hypothetical protein ACXV5Q_10475 [Frankiaceae bacterium]
MPRAPAGAGTTSDPSKEQTWAFQLAHQSQPTRPSRLAWPARLARLARPAKPPQHRHARRQQSSRRR